MSEEALNEKVTEFLGSFNFQQRITFAYSCCLRVYPNYIVFYDEELWGDLKSFEEAFAFLKNICLQRDNLSDLDTLIDLIEKNVPDVDYFEETTSAWFAQDAAICVHEALLYIKTSDLKYLVDLSNNCIDTVRGYLDDVRMVDSAEKHKLFKRELKKQSDDLDLIAKSQIDELFLEQLTTFNNGKSNINLG